MWNIEDYGLIGDCHGCALISREADISWLTLRRFDADPPLWSLLDEEKGGALRLHLIGHFEWQRRYLKDSNILITEAHNDESQVRIIDFMPVGRRPGSSTHDYTSFNYFNGVVRIIECSGQAVDVVIEQVKAPFDQRAQRNELLLYAGKNKLRLQNSESFIQNIPAGSSFSLVLTDTVLEDLHRRQINELFKVTKAFWQEWIGYSQYQGPYQELINRSALTLKLLIHGETGAILAAPTTSLPEAMGGERNWDYRFCWLRDATFTLYALSYLGFSGEADKFNQYMENIIHKNPGLLQVLYTLDGEAMAPERELPGIAGFGGSTPVRIGNAAFKQTQLDTHGEFLDWAYLHHQLGGEISRELLDKIQQTADWVASNWQRPDHGLWEIRGPQENYTYSKVMCWVTLDRAASLLGDLDLYQSEKKEIENFISSRCTYQGKLTRSAENHELDASLLLVKLVGYPLDNELYAHTVEAIVTELGDGVFIKRYRSDDGLAGEEGNFLVCSFWAVNALLLLDRYQPAQELFDQLIKCVSDLGLMSEEYDSKQGHFLGNFPQALSHLALIETASYFALYKKNGYQALIGCHGDRARRMHSTLHGPRAVWNFIRRTGNFRKLFPSPASILRH